MSEEEILFEQRGHAGVVTLNRPKALGAATYDMLMALTAQLRIWENDPAIARVIIKAVPGKAFSAGGDIRHLYERGIAGDPDYQFFADEYRLNAYIQQYPKPYIALIDGIVMGGGVGVSIHGSHRIAGDNISFAMPEVGIGFFPDVGGSYFLPRLPRKTGMYLGLTGRRIKRDDCLWSGLATHACPSDRFAELEEALCQAEDIEAVLLEYGSQGGESVLEDHAVWIEHVFSRHTIAQIFELLDEMAEFDDPDMSEWAKSCLTDLESKSPTSLAIAHRQIRWGANLTMEECMAMEYRIVSRVLAGSEFYEGIRAAIIDKDNAPRWNPHHYSHVLQQDIEAIFAPLGKDELSFNDLH